MEVNTVCPHCGLLCQLTLQKGVGGLERMVFNRPLCKKGIVAWEIAYHRDRLVYPMVVDKRGKRRVSWEEALAIAAAKLRRARRAAVIVSSSCTKEELLSLASLGFRLRTTDSVVHRYMYCEQASIEDLQTSDLFLVIGEVFEQFPVLAGQILRAKYERGTQIFSILQRNGTTSWFSTSFQPRPGAEVLLLLYIARLLVERKKYPSEVEKIAGFQEFKQMLESVEISQTGISSQALEPLISSLATSRNPIILLSPSISQMGGPAMVSAVSNLALLVGAKVLALGGPSLRYLSEFGVTEYDGEKADVAVVVREDPAKVNAKFKIVLSTVPGDSGLMLPLPAFVEMKGTYALPGGKEVVFEKVADAPSEVREVEWIVNELLTRLKRKAKKVKTVAPNQKRFTKVKPKSFQPPVKKGYPLIVVSQPTCLNVEWKFLGWRREIEINEEDAKEMGLKSGMPCLLKTPTEEIEGMLVVTKSVPRGVVYTPDFKLCVARLEVV